MHGQPPWSGWDINRKLCPGEGLAIVDPGTLSLIQGYRWIEGFTAAISLTAPGQVVLTIDQANGILERQNLADIMGQEVRYNDSLRVQVSSWSGSLPTIPISISPGSSFLSQPLPPVFWPKA